MTVYHCSVLISGRVTRLQSTFLTMQLRRLAAGEKFLQSMAVPNGHLRTASFSSNYYQPLFHQVL